MASRIFNCLKRDLIPGGVQQVRRGHLMRGKPVGVARTLAQRLAELNVKDPELSSRVNIGFKPRKFSRAEASAGFLENVKENRRNPEMERKARRNELSIDLKAAKEDWWQTDAPSHIKTIAEHYGIFNDLYGDAYFYPTIPLEINYEVNEETIATVHRGNLLKPNEVKNIPFVKYTAEPSSLWTLLLTTPDGNLTNRELEYCHWFAGNIPGDQVDKGDVLIDYMMPIPARGLGYCRYIYVLYKQEGKIDFSEYKKAQPCLELEQRNWRTQDFYRKHQDGLTPAGLAFYQADWDESVQEFYHKSLQMKAPIFEYDFPPPYIRPQEWFPKGKPFNLYMDKYRDPKDINKDFLLKKLKEIDPFKETKPKYKYPNAHPIKNQPSWLVLEKRKERLGWGRINEIK
ncbi:39S ribosomal protein L38, mitochondrial [Diachasma alloeum]|uniref:39S ribosomal protein L38, mitochondrial n=1 Tax=Diachasma alloeum TaxID=454923 RepID=UPI0007383983|nr:39S ribosomal protein L38, mitochondrial [Diachasma alloeum]